MGFFGGLVVIFDGVESCEMLDFVGFVEVEIEVVWVIFGRFLEI